ncbi:response regulator transcription factor [Clostridium sporogenes]|uniref:Stage 0 sporulation protein A homolog n=1 Tax=Clostridium botulinum TaxID=1491 RepID=A0A6M0SZK8_CLOBO|nr:response regulator transcription factor [Clostridium sporogenes]NFA60936.1 response regulator transcription factor [Clostridium botulinum]NFI75443.1 response regulator transcription factor [Clostridium sporogenes]NFL73182.1 response regulator transcription factor [Clostridium sporogenes]NFM25728.1 response regulator transcription factor [Clostridium sporogenes]NFP63420.1 response regulator transcription factor [Clostridium sporogenes]
MSAEKILIVDDEKEIRDLIDIYLTNEGYITLKASNGVEALELLKTNNVHLIILDVMMPKMDGIEACMKIREEKSMPIIMLSAKSEDMDKIIGLTTGADDYITKPFNPLELLARVKSQLRRYIKLNNSNGNESEDIITIEDITINVATHEVKIGDQLVKLTPREFDILELLSRNRGVVFSIEKIYELVWKEEFLDSNNTVMVHIRKLREKIEENPRNPRYVKTVWGVGYKVEK